MLLINREYAKKFKELTKSAKSDIRGFIFHDSFHSKANGSIIDDLICELRLAKSRGVNVEIYCHTQKQIERFRKLNFKVKLSFGYRTMHSKAFCFDNKFLLVGSHNFTENAQTVNLEMSILTTDNDDILKFNKFYNSLW